MRGNFTSHPQKNLLQFKICKNQDASITISENLSLFFGLSGTIQLLLGEEVQTLESGGLVLVNPFEPYRINCTVHGAGICLQIDCSLLKTRGWLAGTRYSCYVCSGNDKHPPYEHLRILYAQTFHDFFQGDISTATNTALHIVDLLQMHCVAHAKGNEISESTMRRLHRILSYCDQHWNEDISLAKIARQEYFSSSYLSKLFQKYLHIPFSEYIREVRLQHAANQLMQSEKSVANIAYDCGFRSPGALIDAFRQQYGITPGKYRRMLLEDKHTVSDSMGERGKELQPLIDYIPEKVDDELPVQIDTIIASCDSTKSIETAWQRILNIGYARDLLMMPVQKQVLQAQQEIGFNYLRFQGIFDEDMHIYSEDALGKPSFDFSFTGMVFDFILSVGLVPFVELGYMPAQLACEQTKVFDRPSIFSGCTDLKKWEQLVKATLRFLIMRYGVERVRQWRFTTIGLVYVNAGCIKQSEHDELYCTTWRAIKSVDPQCQFGGPGGFAHLIKDENGVPHFLQNAITTNCIPDFISIQCHPHSQTGEDALFMNYTLSQQFSPAILSSDEEFLSHTLEALHSLLQQFELDHLQIYLEETNSTLWQRDLSSDTCYKAAWLVKYICATKGQVVFGYWLLTDLFEERSCFENLFYGGYGLLTYNGIPKAGYEAMRLISKLGNHILDSGNGWMLTCGQDSYQLILYHYCPYSNLYRYRYKRLEKPQDAYSVFEQRAIHQIHVQLRNIPDGSYNVEQLTITRQNGSSFDTWLKIGAPRYPDQNVVNYLLRQSKSDYMAEMRYAVGGINLDITLKPHEVALFLIHPQGNI